MDAGVITWQFNESHHHSDKAKIIWTLFPLHKYISNIADNLWDEGCGINPLRQILYGLAMPLHPATVR